MKKLILIHGAGGNGNSYWNPYIKNHFTSLGWEVLAPDFANSEKPNLDVWLEKMSSLGELSEETILVGHSLGCPFIMSLLEKSEVKVEKAICVAGLYDKSRFCDLDFLQEKYDWEKIKENCEEFVFVHSTNDPWDCDEREADLVFGKLGGTKIMMTDQGHFGSESFDNPYPEFPFLVKLIED